jgi:hypothetical protein
MSFSYVDEHALHASHYSSGICVWWRFGSGCPHHCLPFCRILRSSGILRLQDEDNT